MLGRHSFAFQSRKVVLNCDPRPQFFFDLQRQWATACGVAGIGWHDSALVTSSLLLRLYQVCNCHHNLKHNSTAPPPAQHRTERRFVHNKALRPNFDFSVKQLRPRPVLRHGLPSIKARKTRRAWAVVCLIGSTQLSMAQVHDNKLRASRCFPGSLGYLQPRYSL